MFRFSTLVLWSVLSALPIAAMADVNAVLGNAPDDNKSISPINSSTWTDSHWRWLFVSKLKLDQAVQTDDKGVLSTDPAADSSLNWYQSAGPHGKGETFAGPNIVDSNTITLPSLIAYTPDREFWDQGDHVVVVYVSEVTGTDADSCVDNVDVTFEEKVRQTAFIAGASKLIGINPDKLSDLMMSEPFKSAAKKKFLCAFATGYVLAQTRANLTITADPSKGTSSNDKASADVVTGPEEHAFFTTDILVQNASELKYDSTNKSLALKDAPNNPMVGLNVMVGDPYKAYSDFTWDRFAVKLMASASTPKDVYGAGIGYVFKNYVFNTDAKNAGSFMLFFGYIRTRGDLGVFSHSWRVGISFNLNSLSSK